MPGSWEEQPTHQAANGEGSEVCGCGGIAGHSGRRACQAVGGLQVPAGSAGAGRPAAVSVYVEPLPMLLAACTSLQQSMWVGGRAGVRDRRQALQLTTASRHAGPSAAAHLNSPRRCSAAARCAAPPGDTTLGLRDRANRARSASTCRTGAAAAAAAAGPGRGRGIRGGGGGEGA